MDQSSYGDDRGKYLLSLKTEAPQCCQRENAEIFVNIFITRVLPEKCFKNKMIQVKIVTLGLVGLTWYSLQQEEEEVTQEAPPAPQPTLKVSLLQRPTVCQLELLLSTTWSRSRWEDSVKPA